MSILAQSHGGGGVKSVGLSAPTQFAVTGSPVTSNGTLALAWANQTANTVLAAPDGVNGAPSFRALVAADIPALPYAALNHTHTAADTTTGVFANGLINWASPSAIGDGTQNTARFTRLVTAPVGTPMQAEPTGNEVLATRMYFTDKALDFYELNDVALTFITARKSRVRLSTSSDWANMPEFYLELQQHGANGGVIVYNRSNFVSLNSISSILTLALSPSALSTTDGFGSAIQFKLKSGNSQYKDVARLATRWLVANYPSRQGEVIFFANDYAAEREIWRGRANGVAAAIGFLGATPVVRQPAIADATGGLVVDAEARTAINALLAAMRLFGFITT